MFVRNLMVGVLAVGCMASLAAAQGPGGRGGPGGFRGRDGGGFGGGLGLEILRDDSVKKELELVEEQEKKLQELGEKVREEMQKVWSGFRDIPEDQRAAKVAENQANMAKRMEELKKQVDEILLPHQRDRMKQLSLQMRSRFQGTAGMLADKELTEALGITEEQKTKLQEKSKEVNDDLEAKIEKLRAEGRERILEVLTAEQREKFKKLFGAEFKFERGDRSRGPQGAPPATPAPSST